MKLSESGFTIIELMVATVIFSVILVITTTSLIGISQTYIKGSVQGQTQQTARYILNDISSDIQLNDPLSIDLSGLSNVTNNDNFYFCVGSDVYQFKIDKYLSNTANPPETSTWVLVRYQATGGCPSPAQLPADPTTQPEAAELLLTNERLGQLYITKSFANGKTAYTINIEIGYSDNNGLIGDVTSSTNPTLDPNWVNPGQTGGTSYLYPYLCQSGLDSSFCAVSALTTTVTTRITGD